MSSRLLFVFSLFVALVNTAYAADTWRGEILCGPVPPNTSGLRGVIEMTVDGARVTYRRPIHAVNSAQSIGSDETGEGTLTGNMLHLEGSALMGMTTYHAVYEGQIDNTHALLRGEQVWKLRSQVEPFHRPCRITLDR